MAGYLEERIAHNRARINAAAPMTRRVLIATPLILCALCLLFILDKVLRLGGGWAGEPGLGLVLLANLAGVAFGLASAYTFLYLARGLWARLLMPPLMAFFGYALAVLAVGETLPMLSTYLVSEERRIEVTVHDVHRSDRRRTICRGSVKFGPLWSVRGSTCHGGHVWRSIGRPYMVEGRGNVFGVRIDRWTDM